MERAVKVMRAIFDEIYQNDSWKTHQQSRKQRHMIYRHLVRYFMYCDTAYTLEDVALFEAILLKRKPVTHDTILNSIAQAENMHEAKVFKQVKLIADRHKYNHNSDWEAVYDGYLKRDLYERLAIIQELLKYKPDIHHFFTDPDIDEESNLPLTPNLKSIVETDEFVLTEDQTQALQEILDWYYDDIPGFQQGEEHLYKVLSGYAGTGKTTLLNEIVHAIDKDSNDRVIVTATTNKAVKVLRHFIEADKFSTIHSLLNIKPKQVGTKEVFEPDDYNPGDPLSSYRLVIIDECSMISEKLLDIIYNENAGRTKVLFCGDPAQLQPIGENISKCFEFSPSTLTEVVRHGDTIANKAKLVRQSDTHVGLDQMLSYPDLAQIEKGQVWDYFRGFRDNPDECRMLCWTNAQVDYWNRQLRLADYGRKTELPWTEGDIVIANQPCIDKKDIIMLNSEEGIVQRVVEKESYYQLKLKLNDSPDATVRVIKQEFKKELKDQLNIFAESRMWKEYWSLRKHYHDIKHCYALTIHKSQGSTFNRVVMDWRNIHMNKELQNKNQLIYVAMTRAAEQVLIYND